MLHYRIVKVTAVAVALATIPNGQVPVIAPIQDITQCIAIPAAQVVVLTIIQRVMLVIHLVQMLKALTLQVVFI